MKTKIEYQTDLDSLIKTYKLNDPEITNRVVSSLYQKYGNTIMDNLESVAWYKFVEGGK